MKTPMDELDALSVRAWKQLGRDVRAVGGDARTCAEAFVREHPTLAVGGGAMIGVAAMSAFQSRPTTVVRGARRRGFGRISRFAMNALQAWAFDGLAKYAKAFEEPPAEPPVHPN